MELKQYDIILVNLEPTIGSKIRKTRPCLIISPNEMNKYLNTVVIAPLTTSTKDYPTRVEIIHNSIISRIIIDQIRTIDKKRIIKNVGRLSNIDIIRVKEIIKETFVE
ncbi:MAG: type II toxin-antitoxin system PemK/MazF family toxin [Candidatus Kapabacteria bacterium]|nr:type II toxin-antitoxin system PemK/MazF family toxin [Candidatus Kapabacteria bacterium]